MPPRPRLTFFVELEAEPLADLLSRPEVLPFLSAQGCAVSMGLLDLSAERADQVRRLETAGVPVTAWLLLDSSKSTSKATNNCLLDNLFGYSRFGTIFHLC